MDKPWQEVADFHTAFGVPVGSSPQALSAERALERAGFMREEVDEFLEAQSLAGQADAMIDLIYFALGTLVEMGVRPQALFDIVHNANMQKLWPDGQPRYREGDRKVVKPAGWQDPEPLLLAALEEQTRKAREAALQA